MREWPKDCKKCANYKTCPVSTVPGDEECIRSLDHHLTIAYNVHPVVTEEEIWEYTKVVLNLRHV